MLLFGIVDDEFEVVAIEATIKFNSKKESKKEKVRVVARGKCKRQNEENMQRKAMTSMSSTKQAPPSSTLSL